MGNTRSPKYNNLTFRIHALRQMFQRRITDTDIRELLDQGTVIEEYPDDVASPSQKPPEGVNTPK